MRELRNLIERAVIMAAEGEIRLRHLPGAVPPPAPVFTPLAQDDVLRVPPGARIGDVEEAYVRLTLKHTKNNKTRAAEMLGLSLRTLHYKLRSYESNRTHAATAGGSGLG